MFSTSTLSRPKLLTGIIACLFVLLALPTTQGQVRERDRETAQPRERQGGEQRTREAAPADNNDRQRGTPDGQAEAKLAPDRNGRIARPEVLPNRWYLGVYAYNTDAGVMVTDVVPGSPAATIGLEAGDRIVTVGGFQVGNVADTLYPLGEELQNRANRRGHVRLMVQNVRNNELVNIDTPLKRHGSYYRRER